MQLQNNTPTLPNGTAFVEHELREVDAVIKERLSSGVPLVGDVARTLLQPAASACAPRCCCCAAARWALRARSA